MKKINKQFENLIKGKVFENALVFNASFLYSYIQKLLQKF